MKKLIIMFLVVVNFSAIAYANTEYQLHEKIKITLSNDWRDVTSLLREKSKDNAPVKQVLLAAVSPPHLKGTPGYTITVLNSNEDVFPLPSQKEFLALSKNEQDAILDMFSKATLELAQKDNRESEFINRKYSLTFINEMYAIHIAPYQVQSHNHKSVQEEFIIPLENKRQILILLQMVEGRDNSYFDAVKNSLGITGSPPKATVQSPLWATTPIGCDTPEDFADNFLLTIGSIPNEYYTDITAIMYLAYYVGQRSQGINEPFGSDFNEGNAFAESLHSLYKVCQTQHTFTIAHLVSIEQSLRKEYPSYYQEFMETYDKPLRDKLNKFYKQNSGL